MSYYCPGEGSLGLSLWPCGWQAPQGLNVSKGPYQASKLSSLNLELQTLGLESQRRVSRLGVLYHRALMSCPALAPAPHFGEYRQALAEWKEASY